MKAIQAIAGPGEVLQPDPECFLIQEDHINQWTNLTVAGSPSVSACTSGSLRCSPWMRCEARSKARYSDWTQNYKLTEEDHINQRTNVTVAGSPSRSAYTSSCSPPRWSPCPSKCLSCSTWMICVTTRQWRVCSHPPVNLLHCQPGYHYKDKITSCRLQ